MNANPLHLGQGHANAPLAGLYSELIDVVMSPEAGITFQSETHNRPSINVF